MKLLSERWLEYVEEHKKELDERFVKLFRTYDLADFIFRVEQGYDDPDGRPRLFPSYSFQFFIPNGNDVRSVHIEVSQEVIPVAIENEELLPFETYYNINKSVTYILDKFFYEFGEAQRRDL